MKTHEFDFSRDAWCTEFEDIRDNVQFEDDEGNPVPACTDTMDACYKFLSDYCGVDIDKRFGLRADYEIGSYIIEGGHGHTNEWAGQTVREFIQDLIYSDFSGLVTLWTPNPVYMGIGRRDVTLKVYD